MMTNEKNKTSVFYRSINPFDGKLLETVPIMSETQREESISVATMCFSKWKPLSFNARAAIALRAAELMRKNIDAFARLITLEMGKRIEESRAEVELSADIIEYYAQHAEDFLRPQVLTPKVGEAIILRQPIGVIFGVQPWNFPYYQLARFAVPNIMAGNVVMVKHAGCVPQSAKAFEKLWRDAGAPAGLYTNLFISHEQVNWVIDDPRIRGVALTGSEEAGKSVAARAGFNLKKTTMELGGSDAFIVLDDADLEEAVKWGIWAKMNNMGQCCVAAKRFIVLESVADRFYEMFRAALEKFEPGDPMKEATSLAPLSTEEALVKLLKQIDKAVHHGARIALGGKRIERPGSFMQPTIITNIDRENPAFREEFFGPVALFFRVKNEDEAVTLANDSDYGLGASVFTKDITRGKRIADKIETGMVFINHPTWTAADLPFGGIKNSGYGRELSSMGIQEFVNAKLVRVSDIGDPA